ncbi:hypothetical protein [Jiangella asiatica]|uniref:Uncharacterized protein n=1 Tax=Jiangella asiatica TaxID=2530372 RepID=A0A4R5DKN7_9ACTN|nr:hypothetical protein [Jiangella asiatica]TDE12580.1 hypothetical protein E1269_06985 [Jiangella asiatica]
MSARLGSQRLLIGAAAVLAVVGLVLVLSGPDDDGGSGGSAGVTAGEGPAEDPTTDDDGAGGSGASGGGAGNEGSGAATTPGPTADGSPDPPADQDEPLEPTDTPTAAPTPAPRQTPTLPPGMRLPEPVVVPDPVTVDGGNPSAVALAALTAAYSFDTAGDASASDAMARAEAWLTEEYASSAYDLEGLAQDVQRDWELWAEHQAFASINSIEPQTTDVDRPDTATQAERRFYVRVTPVGRDAWNGDLMVHQWFVFLARDSTTDEWRIVEMQTPLAHR